MRHVPRLLHPSSIFRQVIPHLLYIPPSIMLYRCLHASHKRIRYCPLGGWACPAAKYFTIFNGRQLRSSIKSRSRKKTIRQHRVFDDMSLWHGSSICLLGDRLHAAFVVHLDPDPLKFLQLLQIEVDIRWTSNGHRKKYFVHFVAQYTLISSNILHNY